MNEEQDTPAPKMDAADLWREEMFTDRKVGVIRKLSPVKVDGSPDPSRKVIFTGEASLMTPAGTLPLSFEMPVDSLEKAVALYGDAVAQAFHETMEELKELRRKQSSSILLPGQAGPGMGPGLGGLGGGLPPGVGKLKL